MYKRQGEDEMKAGFKSGFHECWKEVLGWTDKDFEAGTLFEIWDFRSTDRLISEGRIKLTDITAVSYTHLSLQI